MLKSSLTASTEAHREATMAMQGEQTGPRFAREIAVEMIVPSRYQPRILFDEGKLESLAASIDEVGLRNPIEVRPIEGGLYELIQGERRWRSHKLLGKRFIQAFVEQPTEEEAAQIAFMENYHREGLTDMEKFLCLESFEKAFPHWRDLAEKLNVSKTAFYRIRSYSKLPQTVIELLKRKPEAISSRASERLVKTMEDLAANGIETETINKTLLSGVRQHVDGVAVIKDFSVYLQSKFKQQSQAKDQAEKVTIQRGEKTFASIQRSKSSVTVKIDAKALNEKQIERLETFLATLAGEQTA